MRKGNFFSRVIHRCPFCFSDSGKGGWLFSYRRELDPETVVVARHCEAGAKAFAAGHIAVVEVAMTVHLHQLLVAGSVGAASLPLKESDVARTGRGFTLPRGDYDLIADGLGIGSADDTVNESGVIYVVAPGGDAMYRKWREATSVKEKAADVVRSMTSAKRAH